MSLTRNLAANYVGQIWVAVMGLAFLPVYIDYLGAEGLGLIGVFALLQAWLTLLDLGLTPTLTREMARFTAGGHTPQSIRDLLRSLEAVYLLLAVAVAVFFWMTSDYLARSWLRAEALPIEAVRQAVAIMGIAVALRFCEGIYRGSLLGLQRHVLFNALNASLATVRYVGAVAVLACVSNTIQAFYVWQALVSLVSVTTLALAVHGILPSTLAAPRVSVEALAGVRHFAGGMLAITLLSLLVSQSDKVLLSRLLSLEAFGYYALAATVAGVLSMIVAPILQSLYPRLVELATTGETAHFAGLYHQGAQLVAVTTAPVMLVLALFPQGVLYTWSGDITLSAKTAPLLQLLAVGTFFNALMWMPYQSQLAHGWTALTVRVNLGAVLFIVPAILWLVPLHGAKASAWIWVALNVGYVLIGIHFMHRRILPGEKARWYLQDIAAPVGGAAFVASLMGLYAPAPFTDRWRWLAFLMGVTPTCAGAALLCAGRLRPLAAGLLRRLVLS